MKIIQSRGVDKKAAARTICRYKCLNRFSVAELADRVGCSTQTVRKWLKGESLPDSRNLRMLAQVFDIYPEDILVSSECSEEAV